MACAALFGADTAASLVESDDFVWPARRRPLPLPRIGPPLASGLPTVGAERPTWDGRWRTRQNRLRQQQIRQK